MVTYLVGMTMGDVQKSMTQPITALLEIQPVVHAIERPIPWDVPCGFYVTSSGCPMACPVGRTSCVVRDSVGHRVRRPTGRAMRQTMEIFLWDFLWGALYGMSHGSCRETIHGKPRGTSNGTYNGTSNGTSCL